MPTDTTEAPLLAEVDRQLGEQQAKADAYASRSGLLIAGITALTGLLSSSLEGRAQLGSWTVLILGTAVIAGVVVLLMSRLAPGPSASQIALWMTGSTSIHTDLLRAKVVVVEANGRALLRTELMFWIQAIAAVAAVLTVGSQFQGAA